MAFNCISGIAGDPRFKMHIFVKTVETEANKSDQWYLDEDCSHTLVQP